MMQDAFIKIFKVIKNFKWTRPGSLYSWMSRVSINLAFDTARRRRRLAEQLVDVDSLGEDIQEEPAYDESASVPSDVLNTMIESLPEGYRTIFRLYCIDGLSHREIADLLGIKEKSSSASLSRARAMLTEIVRQYWRDLDDGCTQEGWTQILRKMRREETVRSIKFILALLIPVISLLLWMQPHQSNEIATPYISKLLTENPSVIIPHTLPCPRKFAERRSFITSITVDTANVFTGTSVMDSDMTCKDSDTSFEEDTSPAATACVSEDFLAFPEEIRKSSSPKISFSLRAGSGSSLRKTQISLNSSPYIAALTYMNNLDPSKLPNAKSNYGNTIPWYYENNIEQLKPETKNSYRHDLPLTFGLTARIDLTSRIGAECGLEYTYMHSSVESMAGKLSQNLHFIGIPVRFDARVCSWNGFDMYAGIGIKAEKCVAASIGHVQCEEKRIQLSAGTFAGVQYPIGRRAHLYFQPDLSYYLTKTDLITYRTENPFTFSLNAGIRFDL